MAPSSGARARAMATRLEIRHHRRGDPPGETPWNPILAPDLAHTLLLSRQNLKSAALSGLVTLDLYQSPMKKTLSFAVLWTIFAVLGTVAIWNDSSWAEQAPRVRLCLSTSPFLGLFFIWWSWRRFKRYQSVRVLDG